MRIKINHSWLPAVQTGRDPALLFQDYRFPGFAAVLPLQIGHSRLTNGPPKTVNSSDTSPLRPSDGHKPLDPWRKLFDGPSPYLIGCSNMAGRLRQDPEIEIVAASLEQKAIVANLVELYVHDFSEFIKCAIGPDGRFGYKDLGQYWTDPLRFPFLIYVEGQLAGFFLVRRILRGDEAVWDMVEFFIVRGYRRHSIGTRAAREAFARFPGAWQVRVMESNKPACAFWDRAVRAFAGEDAALDQINADGKRWNRFSFNSPPAG